MPTKIAWTDATWNPITGCTKVSPGCAHCYIERTPPMRMAGRRFVDGKIPVTLYPDRLDIPLHWQKPRMVFVPSMGDLWHDDIPTEFIDRVFATMAICGATRQTCKGPGCDHDERSGCWMEGEGRPNPRHTFQVLTKRPQRIREYLCDPDRQAKIEAVGNDPEWSIQWGEPVDMIEGQGWPLPNVWLGVSVENQAMADERIPLLLDTPATVRFVSAEPLLGPLDLRPWLDLRRYCPPGRHSHERECRLLHWVIVGGESGGPPERRLVERCDGCFDHDPELACTDGWRPKPEALRWLRDIREQCQAAGVPFFFKQWGPRAGQGTELDGREHKELPEVRA